MENTDQLSTFYNHCIKYWPEFEIEAREGNIKISKNGCVMRIGNELILSINTPSKETTFISISLYAYADPLIVFKVTMVLRDLGYENVILQSVYDIDEESGKIIGFSNTHIH